jgi:hypothetical protein
MRRMTYVDCTVFSANRGKEIIDSSAIYVFIITIRSVDRLIWKCYSYFPAKDDLIYELTEKHFDEITLMVRLFNACLTPMLFR